MKGEKGGWCLGAWGAEAIPERGSRVYEGPKMSREPGMFKKYKLLTVLDKARGAGEKKLDKEAESSS